MELLLRQKELDDARQQERNEKIKALGQVEQLKEQLETEKSDHEMTSNHFDKLMSDHQEIQSSQVKLEVIRDDFKGLMNDINSAMKNEEGALDKVKSTLKEYGVIKPEKKINKGFRRST